MNQALYRKYRSRSFDEVVGQDHITKTLKQALKSGRISHAYLFTGPRGVGKTSVARILAHEVNQLPYDSESPHLDIIEIDAASNRRIDEIRDLREKVRVAPAVGRYKVYIIDEVHMLTREAFNALLKTLEEPPAHCIFILATTEAHKLPETIISRTQRFEFKPIGQSQSAAHLAAIAKSEKISITPEALSLLAEFGNGSFRDSISYLDQLSSGGGKISEDDVRAMLGVPSSQEVTELLDSISQGDSKHVLKGLQAVKEQGLDAAAVAKALAGQLRQALIEGDRSPAVTHLLKQLIDVPASPQPYDYLEICLLEAAAANYNGQSAPTKNAATKSTPDASLKIPIKKPLPKPSGGFDIDKWEQVVDGARKQAASIYTALRLAIPEYSDGALKLKFQFPLHQKKLSQAKNKELLARLIENLTGAKLEILCEVDKDAFADRQAKADRLPEPDTADSHHLQSINSVFGGAEVLEA